MKWAFILLLGGLTAWANPDVQLLPHQTLPINYLAQHDEIKGLLINHQMGTGKTFLAIGFAEEMAGREVYVIAPRFIETHWQQQMMAFGVKNPKRYHFYSYNQAPELLKKNLSNAVVIMDECHNYVRFLKSPDEAQSRQFSELYMHLRSAHKILGLSGTPIYSDEYDLAYIFNLISGKDLVPFNEEEFRLQYTAIDNWRSFGRGYFTESLLFGIATSQVVPLALMAVFVSPIALLTAPVFGVLFPVINYMFMPLERYKLRYLDTDKFQDIAEKYISYYEIENLDMSDFPTKKIHIKDVDYSREQIEFFLNFVEANLDNEGLRLMLAEYNVDYPDEYLSLNNTALQNRLRFAIGSGREIGNLTVRDAEGQLATPAKFKQVLDTIRSEGIPQTVIYSNYDKNGIGRFAEYLDANGLQNTYAVLRPDQSIPKQTQIIQAYNEGRVKILLLHPEITEGVSLKATRQFHILEPVLNETTLNQIIGRAVRYQSHAHLPENERLVDVYLWKCVMNNFDWTAYTAKKDNWRKRYSELSDWSLWGKGIFQVDYVYDKKMYSPDDYAHMRRQRLADNISSFREMLKEHSIEATN